MNTLAVLGTGVIVISTGFALAAAPVPASAAPTSITSARVVAGHHDAGHEHARYAVRSRPHAHKKHHAHKKLKVRPPMSFKISSVRGPRAGQTTIRWNKVRTNWKTRTTLFKVQTSLTKFGPYGHGVPKTGRNYHVFKVGPRKHKLVLGSKLLAKAGAPLASANHLYFRVYAVNNPHTYPKRERTKYHRGMRTWTNGKMGTAAVRGRGPTGSGPEMTFASFNVRGVSVDPENSPHSWLNRRALVGQQILNNQPGIMAMQELLPTIKNGLTVRQTTDLVDWLDSHDGKTGKQYRLVRENPYSIMSGTQQGMRILYDADKYELLSACSDPLQVPDSERTDCIIDLPQQLPGDAVRWAAYAQFVPLVDDGEEEGGKIPDLTHPFWVVSIHLGVRKTLTTQELASDNRVRRDQVETVLSKMSDIMAAANASDQPIILAGDLNDWQNNSAPNGYAAHDYLIRHGFYDTAAAVTQHNMAYPTVNHFELKKMADGRAHRYDVILTKGMLGATSFLNDITRYDGQWPSDHDMVVAKFNLP